MDKFFEALEKSKGSIALDIANQVGFDETADILEKGKMASIGEIREWNGKKYQKTGNGWIPVKQGNGGKGADNANEESKGKDEGLKIDESKVDKDTSRKLELFVTNTKSIYKNYWNPIVSMLTKKKQKVGEISKDVLASSSMMEGFVSNAIKEYGKEYGNISVSPDTRKYLKTKLAEQIVDEVNENE